MIWLILVESALELVPPEIQEHPSIIADAKRKKKKPLELLLNTNFHHSAMASLKNKGKRGRPDIIHFCLLNSINTPLNNTHEMLKICIHVLNPSEKIIFVDPAIKVPRSLNRFEGLIAKLLLEKSKGEIKENKLLRVENVTLKDFLSRFKKENIHAFSKKGKLKSIDSLFKDLFQYPSSLEKDSVLLIGGFQSEEFSEDVSSNLDRDNIHAIAPISLDAWTVVSRVIFKLEERMECLKKKE